MQNTFSYQYYLEFASGEYPSHLIRIRPPSEQSSEKCPPVVERRQISHLSEDGTMHFNGPWAECHDAQHEVRVFKPGDDRQQLLIHFAAEWWVVDIVERAGQRMLQVRMPRCIESIKDQGLVSLQPRSSSKNTELSKIQISPEALPVCPPEHQTALTRWILADESAKSRETVSIQQAEEHFFSKVTVGDTHPEPSQLEPFELYVWKEDGVWHGVYSLFESQKHMVLESSSQFDDWANNPNRTQEDFIEKWNSRWIMALLQVTGKQFVRVAALGHLYWPFEQENLNADMQYLIGKRILQGLPEFTEEDCPDLDCRLEMNSLSQSFREQLMINHIAQFFARTRDFDGDNVIIQSVVDYYEALIAARMRMYKPEQSIERVKKNRNNITVANYKIANQIEMNNDVTQAWSEQDQEFLQFINEYYEASDKKAFIAAQSIEKRQVILQCIEVVIQQRGSMLDFLTQLEGIMRAIHATQNINLSREFFVSMAGAIIAPGFTERFNNTEADSIVSHWSNVSPIGQYIILSSTSSHSDSEMTNFFETATPQQRKEFLDCFANQPFCDLVISIHHKHWDSFGMSGLYSYGTSGTFIQCLRNMLNKHLSYFSDDEILDYINQSGPATVLLIPIIMRVLKNRELNSARTISLSVLIDSTEVFFALLILNKNDGQFVRHICLELKEKIPDYFNSIEDVKKFQKEYLFKFIDDKTFINILEKVISISTAEHIEIIESLMSRLSIEERKELSDLHKETLSRWILLEVVDIYEDAKYFFGNSENVSEILRSTFKDMLFDPTQDPLHVLWMLSRFNGQDIQLICSEYHERIQEILLNAPKNKIHSVKTILIKAESTDLSNEFFQIVESFIIAEAVEHCDSLNVVIPDDGPSIEDIWDELIFIQELDLHPIYTTLEAFPSKKEYIFNKIKTPLIEAIQRSNDYDLFKVFQTFYDVPGFDFYDILKDRIASSITSIDQLYKWLDVLSPEKIGEFCKDVIVNKGNIFSSLENEKNTIKKSLDFSRLEKYAAIMKHLDSSSRSYFFQKLIDCKAIEAYFDLFSTVKVEDHDACLSIAIKGLQHLLPEERAIIVYQCSTIGQIISYVNSTERLLELCHLFSGAVFRIEPGLSVYKNMLHSIEQQVLNPQEQLERYKKYPENFQHIYLKFFLDRKLFSQSNQNNQLMKLLDHSSNSLRHEFMNQAYFLKPDEFFDIFLIQPKFNIYDFYEHISKWFLEDPELLEEVMKKSINFLQRVITKSIKSIEKSFFESGIFESGILVNNQKLSALMEQIEPNDKIRFEALLQLITHYIVYSDHGTTLFSHWGCFISAAIEKCEWIKELPEMGRLDMTIALVVTGQDLGFEKMIEKEESAFFSNRLIDTVLKHGSPHMVQLLKKRGVDFISFIEECKNVLNIRPEILSVIQNNTVQDTESVQFDRIAPLTHHTSSPNVPHENRNNR
ncbi:MAG: hypothetical protein FJ161_01410 [Gammaproteobacteria bacterium]|nr:hypothetical protein [Gammaproteobacteria bacterium]